MEWKQFLNEVRAIYPTRFDELSRTPLVYFGGKVDEDAAKKKGYLNLNRSFQLPQMSDHRSSLSLLRAIQDADLQPLKKSADVALEVSTTDIGIDTVVSWVFLQARLRDVKISDLVWRRWLGPINEWKSYGNAADLDRSLPVLVATLAHAASRREPGYDLNDPEWIGRTYINAWPVVQRLVLDVLLTEAEPNQVPLSLVSDEVSLAREQLARDRLEYENKLSACDICQLSVPTLTTGTTVLVDALFTRETRFNGALKNLARNDRANASLGRGFSLIVVERPDLKLSEPRSWFTISTDKRRDINLDPLISELTKREKIALYQAAQERKPQPGKRERNFSYYPEGAWNTCEPWFMDEAKTIIGSPDIWPTSDFDGNIIGEIGSKLSADDVVNAIIETFNPSKQFLVDAPVYEPSEQGHIRKWAADTAFSNVQPVFRAEIARDEPLEILVLAAKWSGSDPLPLPSQNTNSQGAWPTVYRLMRSRLVDKEASNSREQIFAKTDYDSVAQFGSGAAVISQQGVFLLDLGHSISAPMEAAFQLVKKKIEVRKQIAKLESELQVTGQKFEQLVATRANESDLQKLRRKLVASVSQVNDLVVRLDRPLGAGKRDLRELASSLSQVWGLEDRLVSLKEGNDLLLRAIGESEQVLRFRVAKIGGAFALVALAIDTFGKLVADSLCIILIRLSLLATCNSTHASSDISVLMELIVVVVIAVPILAIAWFVANKKWGVASRGVKTKFPEP